MNNQTNVYLIGDQTYDINEGLHGLLHCEDDILLISFFEKTFYALREEVRKLPLGQRTQVPRFSSLTDLLVLRHDGHLHHALEQALASTYHLGTFMSQCSKKPGAYPQAATSYLVGICTGALSAAAISSCSSLLELLPVAVHTVVVAFRTGMCAADVGRRVERPLNDVQASWSMAVSGVTLEETMQALNDFVVDERLPLSSMPYVSACSEESVTVSGPPSVLTNVRKSQLTHYNTSKISVYAPYHASHLFSKDDIESILETTSTKTWSAQTANIPMFSSTSGKLVWAGNFRSLVKASLVDILLEPIRWDKLIEGIARLTVGLQVVMYPISTNAEPALRMKFCDRGRGNRPIEMLDNEPESSEALPSYSISEEVTKQIPDCRPDRSKIAIVGMSGRFPNAEDPSAFWELLKKGLDVHKVVPARSWNVETHTDRTGKRKNTSGTPYGCWLDHPELFDNKFFYISPREAPQVDPAQRMALMTAYEAIEQAGIVPDGSPSTQKDRVGVYYGCTSQDWMETNSPQTIDTYYIPGGNRAFIPGRINYFFKFSGPSLSIDTACSSSLAAINAGCLSLWRGDVDTVIAGGTNVLTNPDPTAGLDRGHFLSRTGNCKTFDDSADGYCRGEGVGTVILKRLEDAITDNDPIQGVILSAYTNHSAEAESITRPHIGAQLDIFRKVLRHRGTDPYEVGYIEMHGTGTQAGDNSEMTSVLETFAPASRIKRRNDQKLYVGSAKANIGHGEAFSGVGSLAKVLLMMKHDTIPPHVGIKTKINSRFPKDLTERKVLIADSPISWKRPETGFRKVMINNFSAAGGNSTLLLEDAPFKNVDVETDPRSSHLVAVSAKSSQSLKGNLESLISFIGNTLDDPHLLPSLSYTTTARRMHHPHRVMVNGSSLEEVKCKLQTAVNENQGLTKSAVPPKLLFTFTGQGSQYAGMGKQLFEKFSSFRSDINRLDHIAQSQGFLSIKSIFMASDGDIRDYEPMVVQVATTCLEIALSRLWASWGIIPHAVVGHSLGEYAALNVAGVLSESDTIYLVGKRAELLQAQCKRATHSMLAVKSSMERIEPFLKGKRVEIACINSLHDTVISGKDEDIRAVQKVLIGEKIKTTILKVPYAFHSSQVDPILKDLESFAQGVTFRKPILPVLCPLQAKVIREGDIYGPSYLSDHCRHPVNFLGAVNAAVEAKLLSHTSVLLEIGPQPVVSAMVKATLGSQTVVLSSMERNKDTWLVVTDALSKLYVAGTQIEWREYHRDFESSCKVLDLPAYSWSLKPYWMQYVHDWSLRKGDPPLVVENFAKAGTLPEKMTDPNSRQSNTSQVPTLESTTIHKLIEESSNGQTGFIVVESDIARPDMHPLTQGHKVNGVPLVTPSVYADMALTIGKYLLDRYQPQMRESLIDVADMVLTSALVAKGDKSQLMRVIDKVNWSLRSVFCDFVSVDTTGKTTKKHAKCTIHYEDPAVQERVQSKVAFLELRIKELYGGLQDGTTFRFSKSMAYKMIQSLAQFDPSYQAVTEIVLNSNEFESTSQVTFAECSKTGSFHTNPAYINPLSETGGFVMNCNDGADLDKEIFVTHGWKSFCIYEELSPSKTYRTHVKMEEREDQMWKGDVMVLFGNKIVVKFEQILLQCVPRRLMNMILARGLGQKTQHKQEEKSARGAMKPRTQPHEPTAKPFTNSSELAKIKESREAAKPTNITKVLRIISEESGVTLDDLTDDSCFIDLGIDSLLSLIISSRIKEEVLIDTDSWELSEHPTVKHLKQFLGKGDSGAQIELDEEEEKEEEKEVILVKSTESSLDLSGSQSASTCPTSPWRSGNEVADIGRILQIVSEESGVSIDDLTDDSLFVDLGVDDLLTLVIAGRCKDELGLDIDTSAMFADVGTVKDLKKSISVVNVLQGTAKNRLIVSADTGSCRDIPIPQDHTDSYSFQADTPQSSNTVSAGGSQGQEATPGSIGITVTLDMQRKDIDLKPALVKFRPCSSVLLQGRPQAGKKTLFLFADGAGSASSYSSLPKVNNDLAIVGLNSPYARFPEEMTCTFDQLVDIYIAELRRRQPAGPYNLGGWSAGGIVAYRATQQIIREGQEVAKLVLIDSPVPRGLEKLPERFMSHCQKIGLWDGTLQTGTGAPPKTLIPHFNATMNILQHFYAEPLPVVGMTPKCSIFFATESIMTGEKALPPGDDDVEGMKFLTEKRTDFSPGGWQDLLPGGEIVVERAEGAHHFSMMRGDLGKMTASFIDRATR